MALADPTVQRTLVFRYDVAPVLMCLAVAFHALWCLGYPTQALRCSQEALAVAQALAHPQSLAFAQYWVAILHHRRREASAVQTQAEGLLALAITQGFPLYIGHGTYWRGWAWAVQGQGEAGQAQMRQGLAALVATGQRMTRAHV